MNYIKSIYFKAILIIKYGFHWNKPMYFFKLFRNLIRAKFYKLFGINKFVLRGIDFAITYKCNFNCDHCYANTLEGARKGELMTVEEYKKTAAEAMALGATGFSFQGGEPLLRKDWMEVIAAFKPWENHITITTNGSLLTEENVKKMKKAGVDTVYFSIDSGDPEEHDKFRKHPKSFEKIMTAIELVKKHKMKIAINTTVSRENLYSEGFKKILDYSKKNKIMHETIYARPLGSWNNKVELMLSPEDIKYYYELRKNYPFVVRDLDNNYGKWGCPNVKEVLYITCYGDVCPCPYTHVSLGNVKNEPLKEIRERGLNNKWFNHYHHECLTAIDKEFMAIYLPKVSEKKLLELEDL